MPRDRRDRRDRRERRSVMRDRARRTERRYERERERGRNYGYGEDYARGDRRRGEMRDRHYAGYPFAPVGEYRFGEGGEMYYYGDDRRYSGDYRRGERRGGRDNRGDYRGDYRGGRDYQGEEKDFLEDEELMELAKDLMEEVDPKDKQFFTMENIQKKADMLGITFEDFTPEEFYVTTLMQFTDYKNTLGTANMDLYLKMAKDFLCDEDAEKQYGEKLAAYYDNVLDG